MVPVTLYPLHKILPEFRNTDRSFDQSRPQLHNEEVDIQHFQFGPEFAAPPLDSA